MKLQRVDIRQHWIRIKPYLDQILSEYDVQTEEVYSLCRQNKAFLFISEEGFVILQEEFKGDDKTLFVWIAASFDNSRQLLKSYSDELVEIAKQIGAIKVAFHTKRKGFENAEGWYMEHIRYEREV